MDKPSASSTMQDCESPEGDEGNNIPDTTVIDCGQDDLMKTIKIEIEDGYYGSTSCDTVNIPDDKATTAYMQQGDNIDEDATEGTSDLSDSTINNPGNSLSLDKDTQLCKAIKAEIPDEESSVEPMFDMASVKIEQENCHVGHTSEADFDVSESTPAISCELCTANFQTRRQYTKHCKQVHPDFKSFNCSMCSMSFRARHNLTAHLLTHSEERMYKCEFCDTRFKRNGDLTAHMRVHTGERPFSCQDCGKMFHRSSHLHQHVRTHTGERHVKSQLERPHECIYCQRRYHRKSDMEEHVRVHTGERPFACSKCGKAFRRKWHLSQHMPVHTGIRKFKCCDCEKTFVRQNDCHAHIQKYHKMSAKVYGCECGVVYQSGEELRNHQIKHYVHTVGSVCMPCRESFSSVSALELHKQTVHAHQLNSPSPVHPLTDDTKLLIP